MEDIKDKNLEQVVGGSDIEMNRYSYCKYCDTKHLQRYKGDGYGWDAKGEGWECRLYECEICHCINYYRIDNDQLI